MTNSWQKSTLLFMTSYHDKPANELVKQRSVKHTIYYC